MVSEASKNQRRKPRILVCSDGGLQAGDLAALLVKYFEIERIMTLPGLIKALQQPVRALIVFGNGTSFCQPESSQIAHLLNKWDSRVLMFGFGDQKHIGAGFSRIKYYSEIPHCDVLLEELGLACKFEGES
jgi:hypothetical protein